MAAAAISLRPDNMAAGMPIAMAINACELALSNPS